MRKEVAALVSAELRPGERVLWTRQPVLARLAPRSVSFFLALFGIAGLGMGVSAIAVANGFKVPGIFALVGKNRVSAAVLLVVGSWFLFQSYWVRRQATGTAYVITDRRAFILTSRWWLSPSVRSYGPELLRDVRGVQNSDDSGDLVFECIENKEAANKELGFIATEDVGTASTLVKQLADGSLGREK